MKRTRILFIVIALLTSVGGAIATRPSFNCAYAPQYYYNGTTYVPAGEFGEDFYCFNFPGVCTYYKPDPIFQPNYYAPCRLGRFTWID